MRNTTMKDKLDEILLVQRDATAAYRSGQTDSKETFIRAAQRAARQARGPAGEHELKEPRYVVPPKRRNPFSVHAFSVVPYVPEPKPIQRNIEAAPDEPGQQATEPVADIQVPPYIEIPRKTSNPGDQTEDTVDAEMPDAETNEQFAVPEIVAPVISSAASVQNNQPQVQETPVSFTPPNLSWLDQRTPFQDHLRGIVDACRVAKSKVSFTVEQSQLRQKELRDQIKVLSERLERDEYGTLQQLENLRQIDETIAACALVAEQSSTIEPALLMAFGSQIKHKTRKPSENAAESNGSADMTAERGNRGTRRWAMGDDSLCRREDVVRFFENNPDTNWSAPEIIKELPSQKRDHAKKYLNLTLAQLTKEGRLVRIGYGIYRGL